MSDATDYQIRASASGYQNKTSDSFDVAGSPRTVDLTLSGSFTGTVVDQSGDPVANARVKAVGYNYTNLQGAIAEKRDEAAQIREQISNPTPPDFESDQTLFNGGQNLDEEATYAVAHSYSAFDAGSSPTFSNTGTDDPALSPPPLVHTAGEPLVVTLWDPDSGDGFAEDPIDEELPGATTSGKVQITRVDAGGNAINTLSPETSDTFTTGSFVLDTKQHEAVTLNDPSPGFYRIAPASNPGAGYTIAVAPNGNLNALENSIQEDLQSEAGQLTERAQDLQDYVDQNKIELKSTTTGPNGQFTLALDSATLKEATVIAYKEPQGLSPSDYNTQIPTRQDIRSHYSTTIERVRNLDATDPTDTALLSSFCDGAAADLGASYVPDGQTTVEPPADVTVEVRRVGMPESLSLADRQCLERDALRALQNESLLDSIPNVESLLADADAEELANILETARGPALNNSEVCAEVTRIAQGEVAAECNLGSDQQPGDEDGDGLIGGGPGADGPGLPDDGPINVGGGGDDFTVEDAKELINAVQQGSDKVGDTVGTGDPTAITDNETVSVNFPIDADLSENPGLSLTATYSNGTQRVLDQSSDYVSIQSNALGSDVVRVSEFPLGDAATVTFDLSVATSENTASESETVTNPGFSGTIPDLGHLRISASQPGVDDTVVVEPGPAPQAAGSFGSLQSAQAYAPNGSAINTTINNDGAAEFTTAAVGTHRVELTLTNPGGQEFVETTVVNAGSQTVDRPPTLRAQTGALGTYAVATDGLESGLMQVSAGGQQVQADAVIPGDADPPSRLHVHTQGLDTQPSHTTRVRVLKGENRKQVRQRTTVVLHPGSLSEDALVYRNGEPMTVGAGETSTIRVTRENGSWSITSPTTDSGTLAIRTVNDPGTIETFIFRARAAIPDIPFLFIGTKGTLLGAFVLISRRRRQPPRGGAGGQGGEAA